MFIYEIFTFHLHCAIGLLNQKEHVRILFMSSKGYQNKVMNFVTNFDWNEYALATVTGIGYNYFKMDMAKKLLNI